MGDYAVGDAVGGGGGGADVMFDAVGRISLVASS